MSTEFPSLRIFHTFIQSQKIPPGSSFTDWSSRLLMSANPAEEGNRPLGPRAFLPIPGISSQTQTPYITICPTMKCTQAVDLFLNLSSLLSKLAPWTIARPHLSSFHWLDTRKTFHFQSSCSQTSTCHQIRTLNSLQGAQVDEHTNCESFEA